MGPMMCWCGTTNYPPCHPGGHDVPRAMLELAMLLDAALRRLDCQHHGEETMVDGAPRVLEPEVPPPSVRFEPDVVVPPPKPLEVSTGPTLSLLTPRSWHRVRSTARAVRMAAGPPPLATRNRFEQLAPSEEDLCPTSLDPPTCAAPDRSCMSLRSRRSSPFRRNRCPDAFADTDADMDKYMDTATDFAVLPPTDAETEHTARPTPAWLKGGRGTFRCPQRHPLVQRASQELDPYVCDDCGADIIDDFALCLRCDFSVCHMCGGPDALADVLGIPLRKRMSRRRRPP